MNPEQIKNDTFYWACAIGDVETIKTMIKSISLPVITNGLIYASNLGYIEIVKVILENEKMIQHKKDDIKSYTDMLRNSTGDRNTNSYIEQKLNEL